MCFLLRQDTIKIKLTSNLRASLQSHIRDFTMGTSKKMPKIFKKCGVSVVIQFFLSPTTTEKWHKSEQWQMFLHDGACLRSRPRMLDYSVLCTPIIAVVSYVLADSLTTRSRNVLIKGEQSATVFSPLSLFPHQSST